MADAARTAALEVLRAVRSADAYTNLALPAALKRHGLTRPRRGVRDRARLGHGTAPGPVRRRARRLRRPAAGQGAGAGARRAAPGHPPAAGDAGAGPRRHLHDGRAGALRRRAGGGRVRQRRAAPGLRARPRRLGGPGRARRRRRPGRPPGRRARPPAVGGRGARARRSGDAATSSRRCWPPTTRRPASPWWPGPAARPATSCRASRRAGRRTACTWRPATPARSRRWPRVVRACRTRARSWSRSPWPRRRSTGRDERWLDLCAGPGGKAALLAALAASRGAGLVANERLPHRAGLVAARARGLAGRARRGHRRRHRRRRGSRAPSTGCSSTRPAPASAPCVGGPRRAGDASPPTSTRWSRSSGRCSSSALDSVRPGGVVLYATCSPVLAETAEVVSAVLGGPARCGAGGRRGAAARRTGLRRAAARAPSSCGRTGTGRTPCSGRCCDAARNVAPG